MSLGQRPAVNAQHRHAWAVIDFGVVDGRPMMRQRCGCGSARDVRAYDRTWQPPIQAETTENGRSSGSAPEGDGATA